MTLRSAHEKPVYVRLREVIADTILDGRYGDGYALPQSTAEGRWIEASAGFAKHPGGSRYALEDANEGYFWHIKCNIKSICILHQY